jgi:hypothetical protein
VSLRPAVAAPNTIVAVSGYALGLEDRKSVRVFFAQGSLERIAAISGSGHALSRDPDGGIQSMTVVVPAELPPGPWELVVETHGRRSAPVAVQVIDFAEIELTGIFPSRPHPAQIVLLATKTPAPVGMNVQLSDARGTHWRIATGISALGIGFTLPDDVADGEATVRVGRSHNGVDMLSEPLRFPVTSGPLPLKTLAAAQMRPVAPGQWTDLVKDHEIEFEVRRADRIDVEFRQGDASLISQPVGPDGVHVEVPGRLSPGTVTVRTRTWIEQAASEWSAPVTVEVRDQPAPVSITAIESGQIRNLVWWSGDAAPRFAESRPGEALVLRGHFPVAIAAELRVRLRGLRGDFDLQPVDVDGGVRVEIPSSAFGDYGLVVETKDGRTAPQVITTVRVM